MSPYLDASGRRMKDATLLEIQKIQKHVSKQQISTNVSHMSDSHSHICPSTRSSLHYVSAVGGFGKLTFRLQFPYSTSSLSA